MERVIISIMLLFLLVSCSGSDNEEGAPMPPPGDGNGNGNSGEAVSFAADIRPIIQSNCLSCHSDPPTNNAPMPLTTYALVRDAAEKFI